MTFKACADAYIKANAADGKTTSTRRNGARHSTRPNAALSSFPPRRPRSMTCPSRRSTPASCSKCLSRLVHDAGNRVARPGPNRAVLAWATVAGYRSGDNPARWTGHLKELLPAKTKVAAVEHHNALPYRELPAFMAKLRAKEAFRHGLSSLRSSAPPAPAR